MSEQDKLRKLIEAGPAIHDSLDYIKSKIDGVADPRFDNLRAKVVEAEAKLCNIIEDSLDKCEHRFTIYRRSSDMRWQCGLCGRLINADIDLLVVTTKSGVKHSPMSIVYLDNYKYQGYLVTEPTPDGTRLYPKPTRQGAISDWNLTCKRYEIK